MDVTTRYEVFGPHNPYGIPRVTTKAGTALTVRDTDHTPWNKRSGEVESHVDIFTHNGRNWVNFRMHEFVHHDSGRRQERVISVTLPRSVAERIARHVLEGSR